jgi:hypothetical protein
MTILNTLVINFILPTSAEFPHVGLLAPFDFVVVGLVQYGYLTADWARKSVIVPSPQSWSRFPSNRPNTIRSHAVVVKVNMQQLCLLDGSCLRATCGVASDNTRIHLGLDVG